LLLRTSNAIKDLSVLGVLVEHEKNSRAIMAAANSFIFDNLVFVSVVAKINLLQKKMHQDKFILTGGRDERKSTYDLK
jgi:hypothetical protein